MKYSTVSHFMGRKGSCLKPPKKITGTSKNSFYAKDWAQEDLFIIEQMNYAPNVCTFCIKNIERAKQRKAAINSLFNAINLKTSSVGFLVSLVVVPFMHFCLAFFVFVAGLTRLPVLAWPPNLLRSAFIGHC